MQEGLNYLFSGISLVLEHLSGNLLVIGTKWIFGNQPDGHGYMDRYREELVVMAITKKKELIMMRPLAYV